MSRRIGIRFTLISLFLISLFLARLCKAQDNSPDPANSISSAGQQKKSVNLANLSLEELMNIETKVSLASRQSESLAQAPAAIFVITAEDIRRGGFSSIAEALRTVPGLYVAIINRHWWTVSARGFSDYVNNKMLVLIDGRSVYTPEFGGVYWDTQDFPLEDIAQIEIIRGPGGTLWGANAVNGVINIITKSPAETQGVSATTSAGWNEGYTASVRYGGRRHESLTYRVYGKASYWEPGFLATGGRAQDFMNLSSGGVRADWTISDKDKLTVEGQGYYGGFRNQAHGYRTPTSGLVSIFDSATVEGGHFLSRFSHIFSERASMDILGFCDWTDRDSFATEARTTCDVELQHNWKLRPRHSLILGANEWTSGARVYQSFSFKTNPVEERTNIAGVFGQYEFMVMPDRVRVIAGSKLEHNTYTGVEIQPQIRGVWTPSPVHTVWAAVSRAVRTPSRHEIGVEYELTQLPGPVPTFLTAVGNPKLKSEALRAYEIGYRVNPSERVSLDATIFYNHYDNLTNVNLSNPMSVAGRPIVHQNPTYVQIPVPWQNIGAGQTHGAELYVKVAPIKRWQLATGVTELRGNSVNLNDTLNLPVANTPKHQFNIQSRLNLSRRLSFDSGLYHYGGIAGYQFAGNAAQDVPVHNRLDVGISFHQMKGFSFSVWGRDVTADQHWETRPFLFTTTSSETGRMVVFKLTWQSQAEKGKDD